MLKNFSLKTNKLRAFSLVELSILIMIISVILAVVLSNQVASATNFKVKTSQDRIALINKALENFVAKNKRLPCPAAINLTQTDATYGNEGNCTANSGVFVSGSKVYGMVPTKALGLSIATSLDGFGNKFGYIVDSNFKAASPNPFSGASAGSIVVKSFGVQLTDVSSNAVFAIISYGANGNHAYGANSTTAAANSTNIYEQQNGPSGSYLVNYSSTAATFDDIVFYKDKDNFLRDANASTLENSNATGEAKLMDAGCSVSVTGIISPSSVATGSGSLACNDTANNFGGTFTYNCVNNVPITGTCTSCASTTYYYSGVSCLPQPQCTFSAGNARTGISTSTVVNYAPTSTRQFCNATNFNTADSINYTCIAGAIEIVSGACDTCSGGITFLNGACHPQCNWSGANTTTGILTSTAAVYAGVGLTRNCNATNFNTSDSITYSCLNGTISVTGGTSCDTCNNGFYFNSATGTCVAGCVVTGSSVTADTSTAPGSVIHVFNSSGTIRCATVPSRVVQILVVAAGGSGGSHKDAGTNGTGGGGGGGVIYVSSLTLNPNVTYTVTVGGRTRGRYSNGAHVACTTDYNMLAAAGPGRIGEDSSFVGGATVIIAKGGGGGGGCNSGAGSSGGSGGGGHTGLGGGAVLLGTASGGGPSGIIYSGNNGGSSIVGSGGGGGGAGGAGSISNGGAGIGYSIATSGENIIYGSGGGGNSPTGGAGGINAGNGSAGSTSSRVGLDAVANRGGGGGGNSNAATASGDGGSGVVIIRYSY
jgi:type II secretory pathway pseudopilin PulG